MSTAVQQSSIAGQHHVAAPLLVPSIPTRSRRSGAQQRCRSALVTETRPLSAPSVARPRPVESEVGIAPSRELVEQLEAQLPPDSFDDARVLLEKLQQDIHRQGTSTGLNVVALSGGTGSALVAYLVASVFEDAAVACIGRSPSLPTAHLDRARYTADALGMDLWELDVRCAPQPAGARHAPFPDACPRSERSLYLALAAISAGAAAAASEHTVPGTGAVVFCGANAADLSNAARAGLRRASELPGVVNPLEDLPPAAVTALAQLVGLPSHAHAEVAHAQTRWPVTRQAAPKLAGLARSLSKGRLPWAGN